MRATPNLSAKSHEEEPGKEYTENSKFGKSKFGDGEPRSREISSHPHLLFLFFLRVCA